MMKLSTFVLSSRARLSLPERLHQTAIKPFSYAEPTNWKRQKSLGTKCHRSGGSSTRFNIAILLMNAAPLLGLGYTAPSSSPALSAS
jgi:hypothetical protein